jgi:nucleoside-diphosphate-sugar epimerase
MDSSKPKFDLDDIDLMVFGFGKLTRIIIDRFVSNKKTIICITDNLFGQLNIDESSQVKVLSSKEVQNLNVNSKSTIFTWRKLQYDKDSRDGLDNWIRSDRFLTNKSLFLSSASVYKDSPIPVDESSENLEANVEFNDKYILEMWLSDVMKEKNSQHINLRISNVYGKNLDYGLIGSLLKSIKSDAAIQLFKDQSMIRDYIHVNDVVQAVQKLLQIDVNAGQLNLSTGIGTTISEVLGIFARNRIRFENFTTVPTVKNCKRSSILDCKTLSKLIDWKPISVESAISEILTR